MYTCSFSCSWSKASVFIKEEILGLLLWASAEFFPGGATSNFHLSFFRLLTMQLKRTFTKRFLHHNENVPCYGNVTKMRFVGSNSQVYYDNLHRRFFQRFSKQGTFFQKSIAMVFDERSIPMVLKKPQIMTLFYPERLVSIT